MFSIFHKSKECNSMMLLKQLVFLLPLLNGPAPIDAADAWGSRNNNNHVRRRASVFNNEPTTHSESEDFAPAIEVSEEEEVTESHQKSKNVYQPPHLTLDKQVYNENEAITISFSVGSPNDPFYASPLAPSTNVDLNYPEWTIGLFMRDADPQGGRLKPIVGIKLCGQYECDPGIVSYSAYSSSVTFDMSGDYADAMVGNWPLLVGTYGTGYDAYVLDGSGAAAIGPVEFNVRGLDDEDFEAPPPKKSQFSMPSSSTTQSSNTNNSSASATAKETTEPEMVKKTHGLIAHSHASHKKAYKHPTKSVMMSSNGLDEDEEDNE